MTWTSTSSGQGKRPGWRACDRRRPLPQEEARPRAVIMATRAAMPPPRPTGKLPASAGSIGSGEKMPTPAPSPAHGRETSLPGVNQRHRPWPRVVHVVDESSQRRFLVDTGAAYSIFPFSSSGKQSGPRLMGAECRWITHPLLGGVPSFFKVADSSGHFCWPRSSSPSFVLLVHE
jgi:hypothetical protein